MKRAIHALLIPFIVVALDQATKYLIVTSLASNDAIEIFPFLHIVSVRNTGSAFGMFRNFGSNFFIIISAAAIVFLVYLIVKNAYNLFGLSLILGGAVGNLIDRLFYGKVVDFIDFSVGSFHWPSFNVADSSLTVGIIIIFLTALFENR
jgi:signal peptidase II